MVLTNDIIKSLLIVESTSRDRPHFFIRSSALKMTKKDICQCFKNTSDNPQADSNKKDIIDFNIHR